MSTDSVSVLGNYLRALSLSASHPRNVSRPAVTIARESGAGALAVAKLVAQQLDRDRPGDPPLPWTAFDRNLITKILEDHDLSRRIEEYMPEDSRFRITEAFEYLLGLHPPGWTLREYTKHTIRKLASNGNVILLGRAAPIITANMPTVLHVRLVAPFEFRVKNYAQFHGIGEEHAAHEVRAHDVAIRHYVRSYFNTNVSNQLHYDVVINTERIGFEGVANVICKALQDLWAKVRAEQGLLRPVESVNLSQTVDEASGIGKPPRGMSKSTSAANS
jgi:cytidylate kinase-like protein